MCACVRACVRVCACICNRERESTGHIPNIVHLPCGELSWGWEQNLSCFQLIFSGRIYVRICSCCCCCVGSRQAGHLIHINTCQRIPEIPSQQASFCMTAHHRHHYLKKYSTSQHLLLQQTETKCKDGAAVYSDFGGALDHQWIVGNKAYVMGKIEALLLISPITADVPPHLVVHLRFTPQENEK